MCVQLDMCVICVIFGMFVKCDMFVTNVIHVICAIRVMRVICLYVLYVV